MAEWPVKKNTAFIPTFPIYDNDGDLVSGAANLDSEVSIDGGTFTDCTNEASEIATASGIYKITLTAGEMNGDTIAVITKTSTSNAKTAVNVMYTSTKQIADLLSTSAYTAPPSAASVASAVRTELTTELGRIDAAVSTRSTLDAAGVRTAVGLASANLDTQLSTLTGYIDTEVAAILADTNELQTDWTNGGRLDLLIDGIKSKTDNLPTDPADESLLEAAITSATSGLATAANLATLTGYVDTEIAAILADTNELQTDLTNGGRLDLLVDAIKAKTDNLPATPAATGDAMTLASGAITSTILAASAINAIADGILARDIDNVEATAALHSLTTAILKAVSKVVDDAGTLKVYRTDGTTLHMSQTLTTDANNDPIDSVGVGA